MSDPGGKTKVLLLAGGLGTRLRPITHEVPKCLVPVAGRPLLDYWLDRLAEAGLREVLINNHHLPGQVRDYIDRANRERGFDITEAYEPELLGSAGTIAANRDWAADADRLLIIYADNLSRVPLDKLLAFDASHDDPVTMLLFHAERPESCGIAELDAEQRVVSFVEKPDEPKSDLANAGLYVFSREAWDEAAAIGGRDIGFDVLPRFVGRMRGWAFDGYHRDIGTLESLAQAERDAPRVSAEARAKEVRG
ncbi:MAG: nucleotidyltransferase family protein [Phycisphaeraceae bacterium]